MTDNFNDSQVGTQENHGMEKGSARAGNQPKETPDNDFSLSPPDAKYSPLGSSPRSADIIPSSTGGVGHSSIRVVFNRIVPVGSIKAYLPGFPNRLAAVFIVLGVIGTVFVAGAMAPNASAETTASPSSIIDSINPFTAFLNESTADSQGAEDGSRGGIGENSSSGILAEGVSPTTDTDGDGVPDVRESRMSLNPYSIDTDHDGLNDSLELTGPTDPANPDTDVDGLSDGWERQQGLDPTDNDTDGDGVSDGVELRLGLNPISVDTDDDGINDQIEFEGETNPTNSDTDGDGLSDWRELSLNTSPIKQDSDDDEFPDGAELENGTDPNVADTDGDNLLDGWEVKGQTPDGVRLPDSDPLHKDLYVQISNSRDSLRLFDQDRGYVRAAFSRMSVTNPDGVTGIDVHLTEYPFRIPVQQPVTDEDHAEDILEQYSPNDYRGSVQGVGNRTGIYHHVMLVRFKEDVSDGSVAQSPGYNVVVDADQTQSYEGTIPYRDRLIIRGLLQNIVGEVPEGVQDSDDPYYSDRGWLLEDQEDLLANEFLPAPVGEQISREGFASL